MNARRFHFVLGEDGKVAQATAHTIDFNQLARHVAWQVAHVLDQARRDGDLSIRRLHDGLRARKIDLVLRIPEGQEEPRGVVFSTPAGALNGSSVAPKLSWGGLKELGVSWTPEDAQAIAKETEDLHFDRVPDRPGGVVEEADGSLSWLGEWHWKPSKTLKEERGKPIQAAVTKGLAAAYPRKDQGDVEFLVLRPLLRRQPEGESRKKVQVGGKSYFEGLAFKGYSDAGDGSWKRSNYDDTSQFIIERRACKADHKALQEALQGIGNGAVVPGADLVCLDQADGALRRVQNFGVDKMRNLDVRDPEWAFIREGAQKVATKLRMCGHPALEAFGAEMSEGQAVVATTRCSIPTLQPSMTRLVPIDIDHAQIPEGHCGIQDFENAFRAWAQEQLPAEFQKTTAVFHLSSSSGWQASDEVARDGTTRYHPTDTQNEIAAHGFWLLDKPTDLRAVGAHLERGVISRNVEDLQARLDSGDRQQIEDYEPDLSLDVTPLRTAVQLVYTSDATLHVNGQQMPDPLQGLRWRQVDGRAGLLTLPDFGPEVFRDRDQLRRQQSQLNRQRKDIIAGVEHGQHMGGSNHGGVFSMDSLDGLRREAESRVGDDAEGFHTPLLSLTMSYLRKLARVDKDSFVAVRRMGVEAATRSADEDVNFMAREILEMQAVLSEVVQAAYSDPRKGRQIIDYIVDPSRPGSGSKLVSMVRDGLYKVDTSRQMPASPAPSQTMEPGKPAVWSNLQGRAETIHVFATQEKAQERLQMDPSASVAVVPSQVDSAALRAFLGTVSMRTTSLRPVHRILKTDGLSLEQQALLKQALEKQPNMEMMTVQPLRSPFVIPTPKAKEPETEPKVAPARKSFQISL